MWRCGLSWCAALIVVTMFGCSAPAPTATTEDDGRIIILMNGNSPFWDAVRVGMEAAGEELQVNAVLDTNDATPKGQVDKLRQYASQSDIKAIAISVTDGANPAIAEELQALREENNVHVITIDSDVDRERHPNARSYFIGTDNFEGGQQLGIAAKELNPDGGGFVTFVGRTGAQNAIERVGGFVDGAGEKFQAIDNMGDENDRTRARENVRNAIQNHPDLSTLVGIWSYNAPAIVDVVRELERGDDFKVCVFDAEPLAIKQMGEGDVDVMVVQNPYEMGYQAVRLLNALVNDDTETVGEMFPNADQPDGDLYNTGLKVVVPNEGSPLTPEMFSENVEFMKLDAFQQWLDQYNLSGS